MYSLAIICIPDIIQISMHQASYMEAIWFKLHNRPSVSYQGKIQSQPLTIYIKGLFVDVEEP